MKSENLKLDEFSGREVNTLMRALSKKLKEFRKGSEEKRKEKEELISGNIQRQRQKRKESR